MLRIPSTSRQRSYARLLPLIGSERWGSEEYWTDETNLILIDAVTDVVKTPAVTSFQFSLTVVGESDKAKYERNTFYFNTQLEVWAPHYEARITPESLASR